MYFSLTIKNIMTLIKNIICFLVGCILLNILYFYLYARKKQSITSLELSDYVTIIIAVPESHADNIREAMGQAGAGTIGNYSYCSYSQKGIGRFMPNTKANPHLGQENILETVIEERIETVCRYNILEPVLKAIKQAHPYEELVIDIYPIYEIGRKKAQKK